jgi:hypothetical protein
MSGWRNLKALGLLLSLGLLLVVLAGCALFCGTGNGTAKIDGRVQLEDVGVKAGVMVRVTYWDCDLGDTILLGTATTDSHGRFHINDLPIIPEVVTYYVTATEDGYATADDYYQVYYGYDGSVFDFDLVLKAEKAFVLDWAYQPNGGRSFSTSLVSGRATVYSRVLNGSGPISLDITPDDQYADIFFYDSYSTPMSMYVSWQTCIVDMGEVPLGSVTEYPASPQVGHVVYCDYEYIPAVEGHTYCVAAHGIYGKLTIVSATLSGR